MKMTVLEYSLQFQRRNNDCRQKTQEKSTTSLLPKVKSKVVKSDRKQKAKVAESDQKQKAKVDV